MSRRQARRGNNGGLGLGFALGLVCGLGLALLAWLGGYLPRGDEVAGDPPSGRDEPPLVQTPESGESGRDERYEFFTVLPEMELVVPREEFEQRARQPESASDANKGPYQLQVGSFREARDADALKARLALLGQSARIETVTVNGATWHRVRLGPFDSARAADSVRRRLTENGFESIVLSDG